MSITALLDMVNLLLLLENVPLNEHLNPCFMMDRTLAHFTLAVRNHIDSIYEEKWISRGEPVPWDFFLWGHLKTSTVYSSPVDTAHDLR